MSMAAVSTIDVMEQRLLAWGAFRCSGGDGAGYPTRSVLHPSWSPPTHGQRQGVHVAPRCDVSERLLDARIGELPVKLRDALYVVYVKRMVPAEQARWLQCQPSTVRARVVEAKRALHTG